MGLAGASIPAVASAAPTADEIFKSVQQNLTQSPGEVGRLMAILLAVLALGVLLLVLAANRRKAGVPRRVHHPGKLMREVAKQVNLKPAEMKQLKLLTENTPAENPLTLLLCPSLLVKAVKEKPARMDAKVVRQLARRLGAGERV